MKLWWFLPVVVAFSTISTAIVRRYALARNVLDTPNDRSSHSVPIPRGGGLAIVFTFLAAVSFLAKLGVIDSDLGIAFLGAGIIVAAIGFLDDHRPVPFQWRLLLHFAAAAWALVWLGGLPPLDVIGLRVNMGWTGNGLALVGLAWLLNLYNFMDGIDGIAGVEAVTVGCGATLLEFMHNPGVGEWRLPAILAMATLGFLIWNWPPAKIFMGDVGSGFLGLMLGMMTIRAAWRAPELLWAWLILLGVFILDATLTLFRRVHGSERIQDAHHSHAYQHAARELGAHRPVTLVVGAINLFWLFPIATVVSKSVIPGLAGLVIAYLPLFVLWIRFESGIPSS